MWLKESNRMKHFAYAIPCGFVGTELFVLGWQSAWSSRTKCTAVGLTGWTSPPRCWVALSGNCFKRG